MRKTRPPARGVSASLLLMVGSVLVSCEPALKGSHLPILGRTPLMIYSTITGQTTTSVIAPAVARMIEPTASPTRL